MTLKEVQSLTFVDMLSCLEAYGQCCVERPTGFGKTKLFMDYVKRYPDRKFLYIFDVTSAMDDIIKKYNPSNVSFLSYAAISRVKTVTQVKQIMLGTNWHTIIFDEAHLMGGENIQTVLNEVIPLAIKNGVRILGGTATRLRTDLLDVSRRFFNGHGVDAYTMLDAVNDGIMKEPVWALTVAYQKMLKRLESTAEGRGNSYTRKALRQLDRAYATLDGVAPVYAETVKDVYGEAPDILRFIVFYPTIKAIHDNHQRDVVDFKHAFPDHEVVWAMLSSHGEHMSTMAEVEEAFSNEGKQVQLIFAVNMLNQSYHSDALTGVVMYRSTLSDIIFTQQLGRVMSVTAKVPGIVFDNVGNVLVRPDRFRAVLQNLNEDATKVPSGVSVTKGHLNIRLRATKEIINFTKVYERIMAASDITQEQIDVAKRNWARHKVHITPEVFEKLSNVPVWVVDDDA